MSRSPLRVTERDQTFLKALDRRNAAPNQAVYERFSCYAQYKIVHQISGEGGETEAGFWTDALEICQLLNEAALEWCGSTHHHGATIRLFSQIGTSYWASKFAIEYLAQFAEIQAPVS